MSLLFVCQNNFFHFLCKLLPYASYCKSIDNLGKNITLFYTFSSFFARFNLHFCCKTKFTTRNPVVDYKITLLPGLSSGVSSCHVGKCPNGSLQLLQRGLMVKIHPTTQLSMAIVDSQYWQDCKYHQWIVLWNKHLSNVSCFLSWNCIPLTATWSDLGCTDTQ